MKLSIAVLLFVTAVVVCRQYGVMKRTQEIVVRPFPNGMRGMEHEVTELRQLSGAEPPTTKVAARP